MLETAGQRLGVGIDQPGLPVEPLADLRVVRAVRLKMIELPGARAGNEDAPDVPPAISFALEGNDLGRFAVFRVVIEQQPHLAGAAAEDDELYAIDMQNAAIRQHVRELELGMDVSHE